MRAVNPFCPRDQRAAAAQMLV
eukprot:SAG11_NODE_32879_length_280_cov_0.839779_1_plen_21_part_10